MNSIQAAENLNFTENEKQFIREHPVITVYNLEDWIPFNFYRNGRAQGYTIDYLNLLSKKIGVKFEYISGINWSEAVQRLRDKKIDMIPNMSRTPERDKFVVFTNAVLKYAPVIIAHKKFNFQGLEALSGLKVAVVKGYWYAEMLRKDYPEIKIVTVSDNLEVIRKVSYGGADAAIGNAAVMENLWLENSIANLHICSGADFADVEQYYDCIGIRDDWQELKSILNKAMKSVAFHEEQELKYKWLHEVRNLADIGLTSEEQDFLKKNKVIRVHNEKDWAPFNFYSGGKPQGYTIDLMNLLAEKLGIKIEYITGPTWVEFVDMLKDKKIDVISNMFKTENRDEFVLFTEEIFSENPVIVSHVHNPLKTLEDLNNKTVAVINGYWYEDILKKNYPEIEIFTTDSVLSSLKAVAFGRADATLGTGPVLQDAMLENSLTPMLQITGEAPLKGVNNYHIRMGVRKDWPLLKSAFDKAMHSLNYNELQELREKWLRINWKKSRTIDLSVQERMFLEEHKFITVQNESEWRPFNFNDNGNPAGLSIDYMNLIADKAGFYINYIQDKTWDEYLTMLKEKKIDLLLNIVKTPDREKYVNFTKPYASNPNIIVSRKGSLYNNIESLKGKKVALIKGFFYEEFLSKNYPDIKSQYYDNLDKCLKAVIFKKADAALGELAVVNYFIEKNLYTNLQLSGEVFLGDNLGLTELRIGVRKDLPILHSIIVKAMNTITYTEKKELLKKWLDKNDDTVNDYIDFTIAEKKFLRSVGSLKFCLLPECSPYVKKDVDGSFSGIIPDYMDEIERKISLPVKLLECRDWDEAFEDIKLRRIDGVNLTRNRKEYRQLIYTDDYLEDPIVIAAHNDVYLVDGLKGLKGKVISMYKDCPYLKYLNDNYPDIQVVVTSSKLDALQMVSRGDVYATVGPLFVFSNYIQKWNFGNVQIVGKTGLSNQLRIGMELNNTTLQSILNKVIASISEKKKNEIFQHWYKIGFNVEADRSLIWKITGVAVIVILLLVINIVFKNRFSRKLEVNNQVLVENNKELFALKKTLEKKNILLRQLAVEDELTKLFNRRKLDKAIVNELRRSHRFNHQFGLILIDIDRFKEVNDTYGHQVGDEILVNFASILAKFSRETDIVGRWGGEEFMIICPEASSEGMRHYAEELRNKIENYKFPITLQKTASLGVTLSNDMDTVHIILKRVDEALYQAKETGRNRVVFLG